MTRLPSNERLSQPNKAEAPNTPVLTSKKQPSLATMNSHLHQPIVLPDVPLNGGDVARWNGLSGAALSLTTLSVKEKTGQPILLITASSQSAEQSLEEIRFFAGERLTVARFPDWETLIYDTFSPHQDITSERLAILGAGDGEVPDILIVPVSTLLFRLPPKSFVASHHLELNVGQSAPLLALRKQLERSAYRAVETVTEHGEFAIRGSILDLFPMGHNTPYRIEWFDDEIESIRTFDPDTQRSVVRVQSMESLPAKEFSLSEDSLRQFKNAWHERFGGQPKSCPIYQTVSQGGVPAGIEYYLPLFFAEMATLFDYVSSDAVIINEPLTDAVDSINEDAEARYESLRYDIERPILSPGELLLGSSELYKLMSQHPRIDIAPENRARGANIRTGSLPDLSVDDQAEKPFARLRDHIASGARVLIAAETIGRREIIDTALIKSGLPAEPIDSWEAFLTSSTPLGIAVAKVYRGLRLSDESITLLGEQQLFGERVLQARRRAKEKEHAAELVVRSLTELSENDPVVHIDHGVGRYQGLITLEIDGDPHEFLNIHYKSDATLYVPVSDIHLISRYSGADPELAPWHQLGGDTWKKAKRKAAEQIRDVAAELLDTYAKREAQAGDPIPIPEDEFEKFCRAFPFEETPDQETAIHDVVNDLGGKRPMDRLVCGDVGFGKTEVAMRAAFLAVQSGRQVAILVPTTLLAEQHHQSFQDRFAGWPIAIESLSRFKTKKEQMTTLEHLEKGKIDIIVGTHALIGDQVSFKNLGLLIIDEEHRFGVRQKDKIKRFRANVHVLALTATPIPRTLNMSMSGIRDLSIIATPPAKRLAIKTFVRRHDLQIVKEAIQRELLRGGQVYYLHNEVKDIDRVADLLGELLPSAKILVAHGQMRERELEQVMSDFYHQRANVLVCTTIIETGIDIPNANTIIMERADKLGLAQVHQLRGRVGRSHHQAYAYLMTPDAALMTKDAGKRLEAIEQAEDLGAGFVLATHDLEIRGAGELLGESQTGNMHSIGFGLYMELLDRAVASLRSGKLIDPEIDLRSGTEINLHAPALIPDEYLPDVHMRLIIYKRIANATTHNQLRELSVELIDRFGLLPEPTKLLIRQTELKITAETLGIRRIDFGENGGHIEFRSDTLVPATKIIALIQTSPDRFRMASAHQLGILDKIAGRTERFAYVESFLDELAEAA